MHLDEINAEHKFRLWDTIHGHLLLSLSIFFSHLGIGMYEVHNKALTRRLPVCASF